MGAITSIEWTATVHPDGTKTPGSTWNPIRGTAHRFSCQKISPGCAHCYAERMARRWEPSTTYDGSDPPRLDEHTLLQPVSWRRPRKIFVCSMTDLGWDAVPETAILAIWRTMALTPRHTYQVLTKRPRRLAELLSLPSVADRLHGDYHAAPWRRPRPAWQWPLPNVWLGVTAENQTMADQRIPPLLQIPATLRFSSLEPLLGQIHLPEAWLLPRFAADDPRYFLPGGRGLDWVIAGGESGGPADRRLVDRCDSCATHGLDPECGYCAGTGWEPTAAAYTWVRSLHDQCAAGNVPFFWKGWGGPTPHAGGCLLDGHEHKEFPKP